MQQAHQDLEHTKALHQHVAIANTTFPIGSDTPREEYPQFYVSNYLQWCSTYKVPSQRMIPLSSQYLRTS